MVHIARRVLALPLVNIGGTDIIAGHHKLLLAILWQLMRFNIRGLLQARRPTTSYEGFGFRVWGPTWKSRHARLLAA